MLEPMKTKDFDRLFDEGQADIIPYLDLCTLSRPGLDTVNWQLDLPEWMKLRIDLAAQKIGITPEALLKAWLAEKLGV
jgi:hypothetical protein